LYEPFPDPRLFAWYEGEGRGTAERLFPAVGKFDRLLAEE
jgi:hypothetical protein